MTVKQLQKTIDKWINTHGVRYFDPLTNLALLTEEVGEVARIISRTHGEQSYKKGVRKKMLADELADVIFVLVCIANQTQTDLTKALNANLKKKSRRDGTRHKQNLKLLNR